MIFKNQTIVITGGEPLMWDMNPLTTSLKSLGKRIHLETSGSYKLSGTWDWVCLSPKKTKPPIDQWYSQADELKIIIYNQDDLIYNLSNLLFFIESFPDFKTSSIASTILSVFLTLLATSTVLS